MTVRRTVSLPDGLDAQVRRTGYRGETYSAYVRRALNTQLLIGRSEDEFNGELPDGWVEEAIGEYLDRQQADSEGGDERAEAEA